MRKIVWLQGRDPRAVNRLLPGASPQAREGMALPAELYRRGLARSILMALGERAAKRYNEEPA